MKVVFVLKSELNFNNQYKYVQRRNKVLLFCLFFCLFGCKTQKEALDLGPVELAPQPRNVILMIGDGMGLGQVSAAIFNQKKRSIFESFPVVGFVKTNAKDNLVTDSAAGATAMACGTKTYVSAIGVDSDTVAQPNMIERLEARGLSTGIVTTSSIVHATPASFISHVPHRYRYETIALGYLDIEVDFVVGGGKKYFDRRKEDNRNLYREWEQKGYVIENYFNRDLSNTPIDYNKNFVFFTADDQPVTAEAGREYLPLASDLALGFLENHSENGFFLLIEGAQIDWGGHSNKLSNILGEMTDFQEAVGRMLRYAQIDGETLLIVTADHETGGLSLVDGSRFKSPKGEFTTNGHTACMVPVFAYGPSSSLFNGICENTDLFYKMLEALSINEEQP